MENNKNKFAEKADIKMLIDDVKCEITDSLKDLFKKLESITTNIDRNSLENEEIFKNSLRDFREKLNDFNPGALQSLKIISDTFQKQNYIKKTMARISCNKFEDLIGRFYIEGSDSDTRGCGFIIQKVDFNIDTNVIIVAGVKIQLYSATTHTDSGLYVGNFTLQYDLSDEEKNEDFLTFFKKFSNTFPNKWKNFIVKARRLFPKGVNELGI